MLIGRYAVGQKKHVFLPFFISLIMLLFLAFDIVSCV